MKVLIGLRAEIAFLILVLGLGIHFSGIFYSDAILCKRPKENTAPDFEVVLGSSKLENSFKKRYPKLEFSGEDVWVEDFQFRGEKENDDNLYAISGKLIGKKREVADSGPWNADIDTTGLHVFSPFTIYGYFGVLL